MKLRLSSFAMAAGISALILSSCGKSHKEIPVTGIEFNPNKMEIFIGQTLPVKVTTSPENATNTGELQVNSSRPDIATFEDGKLNGVKAGSTTLVATCGAVRSTANVKVYWTMTKGSTSYPIKQATGYKIYDSPGVINYYDVDFTDGTEHFRMTVLDKDLGKKIDVSKPNPSLDEYDSVFLCSVRNNNENDITIYISRDGNPVIRNEMWETLPITATGYYSLELVTGKGYVANIDVTLSNGQMWKLYYEGTLSLKNEGNH
ncbi:MAG: Ig-like domain-containing protein [Bacteroidales bacterium]|nr:Ig-like domain-containing protein [Bacteroidales bacterium]